LIQTAHLNEEFDKAKFTARSRLWVANRFIGLKGDANYKRETNKPYNKIFL